MRRRLLVAIGAIVTTATVGIASLQMRPSGGDLRAERAAAAALSRQERVPKPHVLTFAAHTDQLPDSAVPTRKSPPGSAALPAPKQVVVSFADGETVSVQLRDMPPPPDLDQRPSPLIERYAELGSRALTGDTDAAWSLYSGLKICRNAYADDASLERALQQLRRGEAVRLREPNRAPLQADSPDKVSEIELQLRRQYERCQGITEQQRQEAETWVRIAADRGEYWARREAAVLLGNTPEGIAAWEALWADGHPVALPALSIYHRKGIDGGPPDYVKAYAYVLIDFKLAEASYQNPPSLMNATVLQAMQDSLNYDGGFLNPQEHEEAVQVAKQLLKESPSCCTGMW